ncbi:MAG: methyltransferase [Acidobacteriota bacterium]|nr:methyltransferase [Acidobacteriota bacterium]
MLFTRIFFKHPLMLGSIIPSSRFLVNRLLRKINWLQDLTIVEYGPGVGTITAQILARMTKNSELVVIEKNADFVQHLEDTFSDPRLKIVHGSAENVRAELDRMGLKGADCIISGIPYSTLPNDLREKIMQESREALKPSGALLIYQFTGAVLPHLRAHFTYIDMDFELFNVLPARLFYCGEACGKPLPS